VGLQQRHIKMYSLDPHAKRELSPEAMLLIFRRVWSSVLLWLAMVQLLHPEYLDATPTEHNHRRELISSYSYIDLVRINGGIIPSSIDLPAFEK
jgi:hypothetical protein